MTVEEFARAVVSIRRTRQGNVTSWGRTDARDLALAAQGGIVNGPHPWDLGIDMTYGDGSIPNLPGSEDHVRTPHACRSCSTPDLKVIHEPGHDHYQPSGFPLGSVTEYEGETKIWT